MGDILADLIPARLTEEISALHDLPESSYRALLDQMPQMVWSTRPDGYHDYYNLRWYEFTGVPVGSTDGTKWNGMFHADDQEKSWEIWKACLASGAPYEVEYRLRHHSGQYRWTLGRAMPIRNAEGVIIRWIGTCTDIHEQKQLMDINTLLVGELSHRIKNIFAVVSALISLSAAGRADCSNFAAILKERIGALGAAHEFVRPHSEHSRPSAGNPTLFGMLDKVFAAVPAYRNDRITLSGDDFSVDDQAATPLALVFHELMTNALKYGALSRPEGSVQLQAQAVDDNVLISWSERDGPHAPTEAPSPGFGTQLVDLSIEAQLGGQLQRNWSESGLTVEMKIPRASLHR